MKAVFRKVAVLTAVYITQITCSIVDNIDYSLKSRPLFPGEDPCKPLYWYPRQIPEYCYSKGKQPGPLPPPPVPPYVPPVPPYVPPAPMPPIPIPPGPYIPFPVPPLPYGIPIMPNAPMVPVGGVPYPLISPMGYPGGYQAFQPAQAGLVPGVPGIVTADGGINLLPMSDAYSDMLEKHKNKMIRKHLEKLMEKYEGSSLGRKRLSRRRLIF